MTNIITASFGASRYAKTKAYHLIDHGMVLKFVGLDLPETYEVHFSNSKTQKAKTQLGNANGVVIPDEYFHNAERIYAWLYIHSGDSDGYTAYTVEIPLEQRPELDDAPPTPQQESVIEQAIIALNNGVARAETAAGEAEASASSAEQSAERAEAAETNVTDARDAAIAAKDRAVQAEQSAHEDAERASGYANSASLDAVSAGQSATNAAESARLAGVLAASIEGDVEQAEEAARQAASEKADAEAARVAAEAAKDGAVTAKQGAEAAATNAGNSAGAAAQSAQAAEASKTAAAGSASDALASKNAAEQAQQKAEEEADNISASAAQIEQNRQDIADQKSAIDDLTALTNRKAGMLVDTASGAIASFLSDATIDNLLGVTVDIEPVQDLHGYDHPWPGGGNVQLLDIPDMPETTRNGVTYRIQNGVIYANGTCTRGFSPFQDINVEFPSDTYTFSVQLLSGSVSGVNNSFNGYNSNNDRTWLASFGATLPPAKTTRTSDIARIGVAFNNGAVFNNAAIAFQVETGSEMSTFRPYSNECPISGWNSVEVDSTGENLADEAAIFGTLQGWTVSDGVYTGESRFVHFAYGNGIPGLKFNPSTQYTVSVHYSGATSSIGLVLQFVHTDGTTSVKYCNSATPADFQLTSSAGKTIEKLVLGYGSNLVVSVSNFQLVEGTSAPESKPYAGNTYTITLGQTVYGAKLSIAEDGSVTALVDRAMVDMGALTYVYQALSGARNGFSVSISDMRLTTGGADLLPAVSSAYSAKRYNDNWGNGNMSYFYPTGRTVIFLNNAYTDANEFKAAMSGVQLCYELATPIEIQLDPVTIATIAGQTNNVWADAGDVSVEFAADLKTYIDSKIAAAVAAMS